MRPLQPGNTTTREDYVNQRTPHLHTVFIRRAHQHEGHHILYPTWKLDPCILCRICSARRPRWDGYRETVRAIAQAYQRIFETMHTRRDTFELGIQTPNNAAAGRLHTSVRKASGSERHIFLRQLSALDLEGVHVSTCVYGVMRVWHAA